VREELGDVAQLVRLEPVDHGILLGEALVEEDLLIVLLSLLSLLLLLFFVIIIIIIISTRRRGSVRKGRATRGGPGERTVRVRVRVIFFIPYLIERLARQ
jgi:hypothetical protein